MSAIGVSERALLGSTQRVTNTHTRTCTHTISHTRQICKCDADAHSCLLVASHLLYLCVTCVCASESNNGENNQRKRDGARECALLSETK